MRMGITKNADRLVRGLISRGVKFRLAMPLYIRRDFTMAVRNKRAGTDAPTWYLLQEGTYRHGKRIHPGYPPQLEYDGQQCTGVRSDLPVTWILKHAPEEWSLHRDHTGALWIDVDDLPPSWDAWNHDNSNPNIPEKS